MFKVLTTAAAMLGAGCSVPVAPADVLPATAPAVAAGVAYTVILDRSLTSEQVGYVLQGIEAWTTSAPGLTLSAVLGACDGVTHPAEHTICLVAVSGATMTAEDGAGHMGFTWRYDADNANVILANDVAANMWPLLTEHELGHALGLGHTPAHASVMDATLSDGSYTVACNDVAAFWALRGSVGGGCYSTYDGITSPTPAQ